jgi:hypothetical protein
MSEYIFKLPDLGEGMVESEIAEWFIAVGDQVSEEDVVGTMMTDKAAVELSSPVSGKPANRATSSPWARRWSCSTPTQRPLQHHSPRLHRQETVRRWPSRLQYQSLLP